MPYPLATPQSWGDRVGIEPTNAGATIRCVNHFAMVATNKMAELTGFEPAISCVTGRHVRPLHHSSASQEDLSIKMVDGDGLEPPTPCA